MGQLANILMYPLQQSVFQSLVSTTGKLEIIVTLSILNGKKLYALYYFIRANCCPIKSTHIRFAIVALFGALGPNQQCFPLSLLHFKLLPIKRSRYSPAQSVVSHVAVNNFKRTLTYNCRDLLDLRQSNCAHSHQAARLLCTRRCLFYLN